MRIIISSLLISLLTSFSGICQKSSFIQGTVYSAEDSTTLSNAHIFFNGTSIGTTSNVNGDYKLSFNEKSSEDTLIVVSFIGKKTYSVSTNNLVGTSLDIYLNEDNLLLDEVQISNQDAVDIMKKAVSKVKDNYSENKLKYALHYKELRSRNDSALSYLEIGSELISKGFDNKTIGAKDYNQVSLLGKRSSMALDEYDGGNGLFTVFWCNWARGFTTRKALRKYEFEKQGITNYQGTKTFKIKATIPNKEGQAIIYIDNESYAFVAIQYELSNEDLSLESLNGSWGFIELNLQLSFRYNGEFWFISSIDDLRKTLDAKGNISTSIRSIRVLNTSTVITLDEKTQIEPTTNLFDYPVNQEEDFWNSYNAPPQSISEKQFINKLEQLGNKLDGK